MCKSTFCNQWNQYLEIEYWFHHFLNVGSNISQMLVISPFPKCWFQHFLNVGLDISWFKYFSSSAGAFLATTHENNLYIYCLNIYVHLLCWKWVLI